MYKKHQVYRASEEVKLDGNFAGGAWKDVEPVNIKHFMGDEPEHQPKTQAKVLYDDDNVYVTFRVEDKFVRAIAPRFQGAVCRDSCAEFFFSPGPDISIGYFNVEINCGGAILLYYIKPGPGTQAEKMTELPEEDLKRVAIYHSEPETIDPEKQEPTNWVLEYKIPLDMLEKYCKVTRPAPGVNWRANFYKCADQTSKPHWLTWSVVDYATPHFHLPEFFGTLEFK